MDKIERQKSHFEEISHKYYQSRLDKSHLLLKELMWDYFFNNKPFLKKNNINVLEPMCGYAEGKLIIENHLCININYEGFDSSVNMINIVKKINPLINVIKKDITEFIPIQEKYDLVILIGGLHHVPDYVQEVVKNIYYSVKNGGYFINFEPTHNSIINRNIRKIIYKKNSFFDYETEKGFKLDELNEIYLSNNFKIIDQIYPGLLSYILYYNPDAFPLFKKTLGLINFFFRIDKLFFRNYVGSKFSFATLTLLQK